MRSLRRGTADTESPADTARAARDAPLRRQPPFARRVPVRLIPGSGSSIWSIIRPHAARGRAPRRRSADNPPGAG